jgi:endonuclease YncB( thermonuclease family)
VPAHEPIPKLTVERGKLYTYRSVQVKTPSSSRGKAKEVRIDCGFNVWRTIELATPQKIKADTLYTSVKSADGNYRLAPAKVNVSEIFTYQAKLERLIDADTPVVVIDCGFKTESLQTLRLRGIDAPELNTRLGRKAKRFVEKLLKPCPFIVVKTYKDRSDKYDRYLVDVYFKAGELDPHKVAAQGEFLNQKLLDAGLAKVYKG